MSWFTRSSRFPFLSTLTVVAFTLALVVNVPVEVKAQVRSPSLSSKLPNQWENLESLSPPSTPSDSRDNTYRSRTSCNLNTPFIALVPGSGIGDTVAEYPIIFWYMSKTSASVVEFVLKDANEKEIYSVQSSLEYTEKTDDGTEQFTVGSPGIMSLNLSEFDNASPLKIGQDYHWELALMCDRVDHSGDVVLKGRIRRVEPNSTLASRLQQATPEERVAIYAEARLWYETLNALAALRRERPDDKALEDAWNKLLQSAQLNIVAEQKGN